MFKDCTSDHAIVKSLLEMNKQTAGSRAGSPQEKMQ